MGIKEKIKVQRLERLQKRLRAGDFKDHYARIQVTEGGNVVGTGDFQRLIKKGVTVWWLRDETGLMGSRSVQIEVVPSR